MGVFQAALTKEPLTRSADNIRSVLEFGVEVATIPRVVWGRGNGKLALCMKPLHRRYDLHEWLVEYIELYRLLGESCI